MKTIFLYLSILCLPFGVFAQFSDDLPSESEQIRAQRIAFITQRLQLTAEESAHFWGVETELNAQKRSIIARYRNERNAQPTTEAAATALIQSRFEMEQELLNLRRQTYAHYQEKISPLKLAQLPQAEKDFRRHLLRQLRRSGGQGRSRG